VAAIFGSTDPHHTPPHSPKAEIFSLRLSCSPCFKRVCPLGTTACLRDLPSAPVIDFVNTTSATTH
jgi:heptosyltransferase-2